MDKKTYIFLDESGKPEIYSKKGKNLVISGSASKFLVIAAIRTTDQLKVQQEVTEKRLEILNNPAFSDKFSPSYSLDSFHAQTDYLEVKKEFYRWIKECKLDLKIALIVIEKLKAYNNLQYNPARLYSIAAGHLLKRFLHISEDIEIIFSRRDSSLKARERLNVVVDTLRLNYASKHKFKLKTQLTYHHNPHYTHGALQIADYVAHAVFQVFEFGKFEWYKIIKSRIGYIQDIFNKKSYSRDNPL